MKKFLLLFVVVSLFIAACSQKTAEAPTKKQTKVEKKAAPAPKPEKKVVEKKSAPIIKPAIVYPQAKRGEVVDTYFGVKVADPYRWLENNDNPEVKKWTAEQNKLTATTLEESENEKRLHTVNSVDQLFQELDS